MSQDAKSTNLPLTPQLRLKNSYYGLLGLHPSASVMQIRQAYRELSKKYHPDTTDLPQNKAKEKFQALNEAYATLSNPELRSRYDYKIGYSRVNVMQVIPDANAGNDYDPYRSAYLDPSDRPLSAGEIFALFILGATLVGCLLLAIIVGLTRGDTALHIPQVGFFFFQ